MGLRTFSTNNFIQRQLTRLRKHDIQRHLHWVRNSFFYKDKLNTLNSTKDHCFNKNPNL